MPRTFNTLSQTVAADAFEYGSNRQRDLATAARAERILFWPRGTMDLPAYVVDAITASGYRAERIGYTTRRSSTWALVRI